MTLRDGFIQIGSVMVIEEEVNFLIVCQQGENFKRRRAASVATQLCVNEENIHMSD